MFGQQINPFASAAKWLFFGFFGIIFMAVLLGFNFKDATWLNSDIATAEAERIQIETAHQQATYEIQERLATAQTDAEIQQIQREQKLLDAQYEAEMQKIAQDVVNSRRWSDVKINLVIFAGGALSIATTLSGLILAIAKAIAILRTAPKSQLPARRLPEIRYVRSMPVKVPSYDPLVASGQNAMKRPTENEELVQRLQVVSNRAKISKELYDKLPHAEVEPNESGTR